MPILDVPYYVQPTPTTCQGTCLKMMAAYLDRRLNRQVAVRDPEDIKKMINTDPNREVKGPNTNNNHTNMKWWLEQEFPEFIFTYDSTRDILEGFRTVINSIDNKYPLIASTNHQRVKGHIILITGYTQRPGSGSARPSPPEPSSNTVFVCHDPYGRFNPADPSYVEFGRRRWEGGVSLAGPGLGEEGPGKSVIYDLDGIRRIRSDQHSADTFYFLRPLRAA